MMVDTHVFNSPLEASVRAVSFLDSYYPKSLDFERLMKIDYILVNSGDFGGPESLHPKIPNRKGELSSRRETVRAGLELMTRFELIEIILTHDGIFYRATEKANPYLELMKSNYSTVIRRRSEWLVNELCDAGFESFDNNLSKKVF
ncbi:ABC-three component system middle component 2 [Photobacterium phosphoreum]|uniref:ABC-three component system middle component 2 n=1 Tax=Photobacterium phosphoreum TaxID=659 RepID=UPI0039B0E8D4